MFLGKAGCLGETQPPRSLADHYATAANPADSSRDKNLIQPGGSFDAFLSLLSQEKSQKSILHISPGNRLCWPRICGVGYRDFTL